MLTPAAVASPTVPALDRPRRPRLPRVEHEATKLLGPSTRLTVKPGNEARDSRLLPDGLRRDASGGALAALGDPRWHTGTTRTIVFRKPGVYRLSGKNVQSSGEMGLQTLGSDNTLSLTVVVR